jgi:hypothetical protein
VSLIISVPQQVVELILSHPDYLNGRMDRVLMRFPNITRATVAVLRHADTHKVLCEMAEPRDGSTPVRDLPVKQRFDAVTRINGVKVMMYTYFFMYITWTSLMCRMFARASVVLIVTVPQCVCWHSSHSTHGLLQS